jgi:hypothetical protein
VKKLTETILAIGWLKWLLMAKKNDFELPQLYINACNLPWLPVAFNLSNKTIDLYPIIK